MVIRHVISPCSSWPVGVSSAAAATAAEAWCRGWMWAITACT